MSYSIPTDILRKYRPTTEKHRAIAYYCPWCQTLIDEPEPHIPWDIKKRLALHTSDRGVFVSCPARRTTASGKAQIRWGNQNRFGIYPLERRVRGCGRMIPSGERCYGIGWYVFCEDCQAAQPDMIRTRGHLGLQAECGQHPMSSIYEAAS